MVIKMSVTEEFRGKSLKLNFTIMFKWGEKAEELSKVYNIDNLVEARFKFICCNPVTNFFISLQKHALAKDSALKVQCQGIGIIPNTNQWLLCPENWMEWQVIKNDDFTCVGDNYYYSTLAVNLTVITIKEKSFIAEKMYEDVNLTDFTLNTTDGSVSVHKAWLSAHSDVFKVMFSQEWKETTEGHVKMEGVTLQTLQHLKQYMYLSTLPDDGLRPLLLLAMYYMMDELKSECISKLARTASSENLDDLLSFAAENKVTELIFAILEMTNHDIVHGAYTLRKPKAVSEKES